MAITDRIAYDSITILEDGQMAIRRARVVLDNDGITEISRQFHRTVLEPGQDVTAYPVRIRAICNLIWTPAVIAAYLAAREAARLAAE